MSSKETKNSRIEAQIVKLKKGIERRQQSINQSQKKIVELEKRLTK